MVIGRWAAAAAALMIVAVPIAIYGPAVRAAQAPSASTARADALLARFTPEKPGLQVLVVLKDEVVFERNLGAADLEHGAAVTPATQFHVASVSKQFTAFAALQLAAAGKLDLQADIHTYLPELADYGVKVSVSDLVHHTSGLRDQWELEVLSGTSLDSLIRQSALVAMATSQKGLNFQPGTEFRYSNTGYTLLAEIVARQSGQSFRRYLADNVFGPLGMTQTFVYDDAGEILPNRAMSYVQGQDGKPRIARLNYANYGATSVHSTARDLARWTRELLHPSVFDAAMIRRATEPGRLLDGRPLNYAFGLIRDPIAGHAAVSHSGSDAGYRSFLAVFPDQDASIVVLSNGSEDVRQIVEELAAIFFGDQRPPLAVTASPDPQQLAKLSGYYVGPWGPGMDFKVVEGKPFLVVGGGPPEALTLLSDGSFYTTAPAGRFTPQPDGTLTQRQATGGTTLVYHRAQRVAASPERLKEIEGVYRSDELDVTYRLIVVEEHLTLQSLRADPIVLNPADTDHFDGPRLRIHVLRNSAGLVDGVTIGTGRVRDVMFSRIDLSPALATARQ